MGEIDSLLSTQRLVAGHDVASFACGRPDLDEWLKRRALSNEGRASRTYVVATGVRVVGYYSLAAGAVERVAVPRKIRHDLPESVPVMVLGRLATDVSFQGRGVGKGMLKDALVRSIAVSEVIGIRAVLVHALDDDAVTAYAPFGFVPSPIGERTLVLPIETVIRALG